MIDDPDGARLNISDDEIRESIETGQFVKQRERGIDLTLFSPRAGSMEHHIGNAHVSEVWSRVCIVNPQLFTVFPTLRFIIPLKAKGH
jgi:4-oxalmesaconate hydratase